MALSGEDITAITQIVHQANEAQFDRVSEKMDLMIEPIKETLSAHIRHDEGHDKEVDRKLDILSAGHQKLMGVAAFCVFMMPLVTWGLNQI